MYRIACTSITGRIMAGRVNKAGDSFVGEKKDVTSDVLKAIIDKLEFHGGQFEISSDGEAIAMLRLEKAPVAGDGIDHAWRDGTCDD